MKAILKFTTDNCTSHRMSLEITNAKDALLLDEKLDDKLNKLECGLDTMEIEYNGCVYYTCEDLYYSLGGKKRR